MQQPERVSLAALVSGQAIPLPANPSTSPRPGTFTGGSQQKAVVTSPHLQYGYERRCAAREEGRAFLSSAFHDAGVEHEASAEHSYARDPDGFSPMTDAAADDVLRRIAAAELAARRAAGGGGTRSIAALRPMGEDELGEGEEFGAVPMPPFPDENIPIVPRDVLDRHTKRFYNWQKHPAAHILLTLLKRRGVHPIVDHEIVDYHMAEGFLDSVLAIMRGAYFVIYKRHSVPKERYFRLQMLPDQRHWGLEKTEYFIPYLAWYIHENGWQCVDKVPLDTLVGVTTDTRSINFRRYLASHNIIKGCYKGNHKSRLRTDGCITLWFFDREAQKPSSVDLLTVNTTTHRLWVTTMKAILSVNSVCLLSRDDDIQQMQKLLKMTQKMLTEQYLDDDSAMNDDL